MKKILSILIIITLSIQALNARIISLGIYNHDSFRVTTQKYHYTYLYSKVGLDVQTLKGNSYQHLYFSLGIPFIEAIVKIPLNDNFYESVANISPGEKPIAIAFNFEKIENDIVSGLFFEIQEPPEFFSFGGYMGKAFGEEKNHTRTKSMNKINKYGTYIVIGSGIVLLLGFFRTAGHQ